MHSSPLAAAAIDASLREPAREAALQRRFERRIRRGVREFSWFIYRFNSPVMRRLFAHPRNFLRVEDGVISMLAGDVFDSPAVKWRMRVFRVIYALNGLATWRAWLGELATRRRQAQVEFSGGTTPVDPA
jgi:hypothetical protein